MRMLPLLLALAASAAAAVTPPDQLKVPPGFKVELLREAGPDEGSWICMTQDDAGRLYISTQGAPKGADQKTPGQWGGLWRTAIVMTENPTGNIQPHVLDWEKVSVPVGDAMGMLWAFDSLYVSGMGPQGRGIYRCKSSKGDGNLDTATLFKAIPGGAGEHGAHAIVLGPDKKLYIVNGNSTGILDGLAPDSPYRHWGEDDLLPRLKDPVATFFDKIKAPYGCVYRTDADGTKWELFAGGFRNPYDIAFNPDGELFTYDSDMEWDRGLPWYRPTRILHVVPGGEYGFREGSAKWPAYFPDSLPAVADIGVGCPTGIAFYPGSRDVGTDARVWPEKYRRALFLHDWTYGRILAVTLHEKGASYTAKNDLTSYTFPKDAEANGDVEVFLSGKGMPVTDLEFLRDGSMVFTVGGRGTAAALYRVSYRGPAGPDGQPGRGEAGIGRPSGPSSPEKRPSERILRPGDIDGLLKTEAAPNQNAPEAQRKLAGGAASEASATTGSPSAKASAPDGAQDSNALLRKLRQLEDSKVEWVLPADEEGWLNLIKIRDVVSSSPELAKASRKDPVLVLQEIRFATPLFQGWCGTSRLETLRVATERALPDKTDIYLRDLMALARTDAGVPDEIIGALKSYPMSSLSDDLKLLKLRILELSFARQGRPSEERVKAVMEELLAHYPAAGGGAGAPRTLPGDDAGKRAAERAFHQGAPVDAPAWRLNRELCALLTWLSNPELGALNAELSKAPAPAKGKTGDFRPSSDKSQKNSDIASKNAIFPEIGLSGVGDKSSWVGAEKPFPGAENSFPGAESPCVEAEKSYPDAKSSRGGDETSQLAAKTPFPGQKESLLMPENSFPRAKTPLLGQKVSLDGPDEPFSASDGRLAPADVPLLAQATPAAAKADALPSEEPPVIAQTPNSGLGPVPNPGADVFPGRKGAAFHAELGRQVIEKTLALMDAAPSQEEQIWYALCLRWAHGWTPELRVRYFRWFHEKASRFTGGNSFAKFVEAIRADAASRMTWAESALLAEWMHPVAAPAPAAALKPRAFVKAWTLPELEAALDQLKDRKPDLARGKDLYTQAQCAQCHLFRDAGGNVGPDLTAVAQRFGRHDILESITDPSKVVSEQYAMVTLTILDGKGGTAEVSGLVKDESSATITLLTDPLAGKTSNLYKNVVVKREKAAASIMPPGLLYTLTAEEVADLLALFGAK